MNDLATEGLVSDVQRFSLHDGPGIRTTVFLKGCPLECAWCHNPEAIAPRPELAFARDRCNDCGECVNACGEGALSRAAGERLELDRSRCTACGHCVAECARSALAVVGRVRRVRDVLNEVDRDREYYRRSGGGLTISGGEPMAQPRFTTALARAARARGMHTCIDTSGFAQPALYRDLLGCVDLFLFDYKATDDAAHRRLTGQPAALVRASFDLLYRSGACLVLRCPLVPGLNDSDAHLAAIAEFARTHPRLHGVEIMAYHDLGRGKAARVDRQELGLPAATDAERRAWLATLAAFGCEARLG